MRACAHNPLAFLYTRIPALKETGQAVVLNITVPRHYIEGRNFWVGHMQSAKAAITTLSHTST